jgi:non-specific serine/threonine protein kinase
MQFINPNILGVMLFLPSITKFPLKTRRNSLLELKNLVSPFILRRTKEQVLKDLPNSRNKFSIVIWNPNKRNYTKKKSQKREMHFKTDGSGIDNIINTLMRLSN